MQTLNPSHSLLSPIVALGCPFTSFLASSAATLTIFLLSEPSPLTHTTRDLSLLWVTSHRILAWKTLDATTRVTLEEKMPARYRATVDFSFGDCSTIREEPRSGCAEGLGESVASIQVSLEMRRVRIIMTGNRPTHFVRTQDSTSQFCTLTSSCQSRVIRNRSSSEGIVMLCM